jgi:tetratricopeptide (TPR) repeat protein
MLLLALIAGLQSPASPTPAPRAQAPVVSTSEQFDKACVDIKALVRACKWKQVRERWLAVLDQHAEKPWVRAARVTIEDDLRHAMFWLAHPAPDMRALVSGEVVLFDRTNDTVRIRYDPSNKAQAARNEAAKRPRIVEPLPGMEMPEPFQLPPVYDDFLQVGPLMVHPLEFSGDYSIEIRCSPGSIPPSLGFFLSDEEIYFARPGVPDTDLYVGEPGVLFRWTDDGVEKEVDRASAPVVLGKDKAYTVFASVTASRITVSVAGRQILTCPKTKESFGRFGMTPAFSCLSIVVNGKSYAQWIDALVDESVRKDRTDYDKAWKAEEVLPSWLVLRTKPAPDPEVTAASKRVDSSMKAADVTRVEKLLRADKTTECAEFLATIQGEGDMLLGAGMWLAICKAKAGRFEESAAALEPVCAAVPKYSTARRLRADAWQRSRGFDAALAERRQLVQEFPTDATLHIDLANMLLHEGRMDEAWKALVAGYAAGADSKLLDEEARVLDRAIKGPSWRATQRVTTKHYEIASELDKGTCTRVGKVLEEAYAHYQRTIARPQQIGRPMRVFVFSTVEGMRAYCRDLDVKHAEWMGGMFSPDLQQLVVCELIQDREFVATVRHEGFHQYLDQVAPDAPVWLNEGLAQYFESLRAHDGKLVVDRKRLGSHESLRKLKDWNQFARLLQLSHQAFYERRDVNYDLAWILVQYLMHAPEPHAAIGPRLIATLAGGKADAAAIERAFEGVDMKALGEAVKKYAATLL